MLDSLSYLWSLMTVFFTVEVVTAPLLMAFLLMPTIFYVIYLLVNLLDPNSWRR